jgi:hypothetical protein
VTANEPETPAIPPAAPDAQQDSAGTNASAVADNELWLTYLNYDPSVQQAVRRLGALSSANVDEFRALLLRGRDRSRIKEYESDAIRRLQGEAFVGDEELQRALIVLNAEDPRLGDEFKKVLSTTGRPSDLDQMVSAIRSQKEIAAQPDRAKIDGLPRTQPPAPAQAVPKPLRPPSPAQVEEPPQGRQAAPVPVILDPIESQQAQRASWTKRLAIPGALFLAGAVGFVIVSSKLATDGAPKVSLQTTTVPLRPAADEGGRTVLPVVPDQSAQHLPTPSARIAKPAQNGLRNLSSGQAPSPASGEPVKLLPGKDVPASLPPDDSPTAAPVPGAHYKVVRGDILTEIAVRAYKDASKFVLIQRANPSLRGQPDKIYIDQVIYLPPSP